MKPIKLGFVVVASIIAGYLLSARAAPPVVASDTPPPSTIVTPRPNAEGQVCFDANWTKRGYRLRAIPLKPKGVLRDEWMKRPGFISDENGHVFPGDMPTTDF